MVNAWIATMLSVIIVSLLSFIGLFFFALKIKNYPKILLLLVGFATGALLGDVFIHLLPELAEEGITLTASLMIIAGMFIFFILEKIVHWRHCHIHTPEHEKVHTVATMNLVGDALHNLIDGMIIAASYLANIPLGIATTIAVVLHEIPQEIGDFAILLHAGMKKTKALFFNFMSACTAIIGAVLVLLADNAFGNMLTIMIPLTAGGFLYIAGSDLIPELHRKTPSLKESLTQLFMLCMGVGVMLALILIE